MIIVGWGFSWRKKYTDQSQLDFFKGNSHYRIWPMGIHWTFFFFILRCILKIPLQYFCFKTRGGKNLTVTVDKYFLF